jgi:hypothetical protein
VTTNTFVFAPDGLRIASSRTPGGIRRGDVLTVCVEQGVYTFDMRTGTCRKWSETMSGMPAPASGQCVVDAAPSFVVRPQGAGRDIRLNFSGDALLSTELAAQVVVREASFEAATMRANALVHR